MKMIKIILLATAIVQADTLCKRRCRTKNPATTCGPGFNCLVSNTTGKPDCFDVCNGVDSGLVPHPTNCAMYYDCSDNTVIEGLDEPRLRMCKSHQLFDTETSTCRYYNDFPGCGNRYVVPTSRCEYHERNTPAGIASMCSFIFERSDCSTCGYPGCKGLSDGVHYAPKRLNLTVQCHQGRDLKYSKCSGSKIIILPDTSKCHSPP